ncbi:hypothetical protein [Streptomyces sp. DH37]|uniref:hypothetical protein n=1 Tax=Streptomyces sp. DH37 TaxID=3040122 RepID=UPI0024420730|nr:hypothetical protein [Streptomyces sp. DH37]MDG9704264.1 hypothetical protein [Streptomyces sp. DH37]
MPRPNPAQLAYGSATVILSALVMLLVSQARSGAGVAVVACAALALGLLVAVKAPAGRSPRPATGAVPVQRGAERTGDERRLAQTSSRR